MAILNEKNDYNKKVIHLMITDRCDRKCPDCCNNQYDLNEIPIITNEELSEARDVFLTGGEPFVYSNPCEVAGFLKRAYPNIQRVIVYTNAFELYHYLRDGGQIYNIDGLTISIKNNLDSFSFRQRLVNYKDILNLSSNWVYTFEGFEDIECPKEFKKSIRTWQKNFVASSDSIFRRAAHWIPFYDIKEEF